MIVDIMTEDEAPEEYEKLTKKIEVQKTEADKDAPDASSPATSTAPAGSFVIPKNFFVREEEDEKKKDVELAQIRMQAYFCVGNTKITS